MSLWFSMLFFLCVVIGLFLMFADDINKKNSIVFGVVLFTIILTILFTLGNPNLIPKSFLIYEITSKTTKLESLKNKKYYIEKMSFYSDYTKDKLFFELDEKISKIEIELYDNKQILEEK